MPIPPDAVPIVIGVLKDLVPFFGEQILKFARQQHPELNEAPVSDEGASMDRARDEALRRAVALGDIPDDGSET